MKTRISILLGVVFFVATGCVNLSAPRNTLRSALDAIQNDKLEDFRKTLGPALVEKLGNPQSLLQLRVQLASVEKLGFGEEILIRKTQGYQGHGQFGDVLRVFSEQVLGKIGSSTSVVLTANVTCEVRAEAQSGTGNDGSPPIILEAQTCLITETP